MVKARVNGHGCILYYDERVLADNSPFGYPHRYQLRHDEDDWTCPVSVEQFVLVNFFGTIFLENALDLGEDGYVEVVDFETEDSRVPFRLSRAFLRNVATVARDVR